MSGVTQDGILQTDDVGGGGSSTSVAIGQPINATDAALLDVEPTGTEYGLVTRLIPPAAGLDVNIINPVPIAVISASYATRLDEASAVITYVGIASPGSLPSNAVWQIKRLNSTTGLVVEFANGNSNFTNIWDNRASLSYS